jgi:hypothetical protein
MHHSMHDDYSEIEQGLLAIRLPFPMAGFSASTTQPKCVPPLPWAKDNQEHELE